VSAAGITGIEGQPTLVFDPAPGLSARVVLTVAPLDSAASPTLLPKPLRDAAERPPGRPRPVRLDARRAWLYSSVPVRRGEETMDITVLPTTAGVVAIACLAPRFTFSAAAGCESALRLTLHRARAMVPAQDLGFKLRLGDVARGLNQERVEQRVTLRQARTPRAQALTARQLAAAHAQAARALAPLARRGTTARVVASLRNSSSAYENLSRSATTKDRAAFVLASRAIDEADDRLNLTLRALDGRHRTASRGRLPMGAR